MMDANDKDLPECYVPKALRPESKPSRAVSYAVGIPADPGPPEYVFGATPDIESCLDYVPASREPHCLIRFNADHTETTLYQWAGKSWRRFVARSGA